MSHDDDRNDAERVRAGDVQAFEGIVRRNMSKLRAFGRRFFRNLADLDDFVQEVFLQAYRRLETFRGESTIRAWILSIAYRIAMRESRKPSYESLESEAIPDTTGNPERIVLRQLAESTLLDAMRRLPARLAVCLDLFFFLGLSYAEISVTTGIPINTVRSHIRRGKLRLKEAIGPEMEDSYGVS